jgi:hypothetical protein
MVPSICLKQGHSEFPAHHENQSRGKQQLDLISFMLSLYTVALMFKDASVIPFTNENEAGQVELSPKIKIDLAKWRMFFIHVLKSLVMENTGGTECLPSMHKVLGSIQYLVVLYLYALHTKN